MEKYKAQEINWIANSASNEQIKFSININL